MCIKHLHIVIQLLCDSMMGAAACTAGAAVEATQSASAFEGPHPAAAVSGCEPVQPGTAARRAASAVLGECHLLLMPCVHVAFNCWWKLNL